MSARHDEAFRAIRREHAAAVAALKLAQGSQRRGAPGFPGYDPARLDAAIATAGDAYALLLIATAEAFLREYLLAIVVNLGAETKLSVLIDKAAKELNLRTAGVKLRPDGRAAMHSLRVGRNAYAHGHGHGRSVFPSVPRVESIVSKFLSPFP